MIDENLEVLMEFTAEAREALEEIGASMVELEQAVEASGALDRELLDQVFRAFHSIKGSAGFFGFSRLVEVTHCAESLLDLVRSDKLTLTPAHVTVIGEAIDFLTDAFDIVEETSKDEGLVGGSELAARLDAAQRGPTAGGVAATAVKGDTATDDFFGESVALELPPPFSAEAATQDLLGSSVGVHLSTCLGALDLVALSPKDTAVSDAVSVALADTAMEAMTCGCLNISGLAGQASGVVDQIRAEGAAFSPAVVALLRDVVSVLMTGWSGFQEHGVAKVERASELGAALERAVDVLGDPFANLDDELVEREVEPVSAPEVAAPVVASSSAPAAPAKQAESSESAKPKAASFIRVDVEKLDVLMNLVGELILSSIQVTGHPELDGLELEAFHRSALDLTRITRGLQDVATSLRMLPVRGSFRKMIRLVRDLAKKQGKSAVLITHGEDTEVDKTVIEQVADPLVHIIRNAVDHGIERPQERIAAGKPEQGRVQLSAGHSGGEVRITIQDDGRGLDPARIRAKAVERGLIRDDEVLSHQETLDLIFAPGFSTADVVTDLSGRGVGMDVVKRNIEGLGGRVELESTLGTGSCFTLAIPLTLAIIEGMVVRLGNVLYTLPLLAIRESVVIPREDLIQLPEGGFMVRVRDTLVPVIRLGDLHKVPGHIKNICDGIVVIVEHAGRVLGLLVDHLVGQQQTVIKPIPPMLAMAQGLAGCSIERSGEISLILDLTYLVNRFGSRLSRQSQASRSRS